MTLDEYGLIWLSDPWLAAFAFVAIVGAVLWSHGWVVSGAPPRPTTIVARVRRDAIGGAAATQQAFKIVRPRGTRRGVAADTRRVVTAGTQRIATADARRSATLGAHRAATGETVVPFACRRARTAA